MSSAACFAATSLSLCLPLLALAANRPVTAVERDAYVLYDLTHRDAGALRRSGAPASETITVTVKGETVEYRFREHTLSCGTHMTGFIRETRRGGKTTIEGAFDVSSNPYGIRKLLLQLTGDDQGGKPAGTFTIDGAVVDAALLE